jgi:hypothetical protein
MTPVASARSGASPDAPWAESGSAGPQSDPAAAADDAGGLPRRVKQASLAPQLRDNPPRRRPSAGPAAAGADGADGPTPDELRKTMTALQRGLQAGRWEPDSGPGEPAAEPAPGGPDES